MYLRKATALLLLWFAAMTTDAHLIFRISGGGLEKPSYMLGTVHVMSGNLLDSIPAFTNAEAQCQQLYAELDFTNKQRKETMREHGQKIISLPDSMTIFDVLDEEKTGILNEKMKAVFKINLADSAYKELWKMQPVAFTGMFTLSVIAELMKKYPNVNRGNMMDSGCITRAKSRGWQIGELDRMIQDQDSVAKMQETLTHSIDVQVDSLMSFLEKYDTWKTNTEKQYEQTQRIIEYWMNSDYDGLEAYSASVVDMAHPLIVDRNRKWLPIITDAIRAMPTLFVFGAAHLPGTNGIVNMLRQAGYTVEQIKDN